MSFLPFILAALSYPPPPCWNVDISPRMACVYRKYGGDMSKEDRVCFENKADLDKFIFDKKLNLCMDEK